MIKLLVLALILFNLSGCNASATPAATAALPAAKTQAQPEPTAVTGTPTATAPIQASATATALPTPTAAPLLAPTSPPAPARLSFSLPIGVSGMPLGDGFFIRHGFTAENTWYNPGYWHTGEDWYAIEGDTAGARVYAIADGQVAYAGANYPGRVVIVQHTSDLYSMYGHLDPALSVEVGQPVARGALIGTVLRRGDQTPNHLHFEIRTFLTAREVNGAAPRYGFRCGPSCPPGPGYWPISAPDLPADLGWRNPAHTIARRMLAAEGALGAVVVATRPVSQSVTLWSGPPNDPARTALGALQLHAGEQFALMALYAGAEDTRRPSTLAYSLWYQVELPAGRSGWVQAAVPSNFETGSDGRSSSVYFNFLPATLAQ